MWRRVRESNPKHIGGRRALSPLRQSCKVYRCAFSVQPKIPKISKQGQLVRWYPGKVLLKICRLLNSMSDSQLGYPSLTFRWHPNRPFPSSLLPLFPNESKCETFHMKMSSAYSFIFMQIKVILIRIVSHLDSLWNRGTRRNSEIGPLHDLVTWYKIKYTGEQVAHWDFQNKGRCIVL